MGQTRCGSTTREPQPHRHRRGNHVPAPRRRNRPDAADGVVFAGHAAHLRRIGSRRSSRRGAPQTCSGRPPVGDTQALCSGHGRQHHLRPSTAHPPRPYRRPHLVDQHREPHHPHRSRTQGRRRPVRQAGRPERCSTRRDAPHARRAPGRPTSSRWPRSRPRPGVVEWPSRTRRSAGTLRLG